MEKGYANATAIGLGGFGLTVVLLSLVNAGFISNDVMILSMGFFLGGAAEMVAGIIQGRNGDHFGMTVFILFWLFWWSFIGINAFGVAGLVDTPFAPASSTAVGAYLFLWGVLAVFVFIAGLKGPMTLKIALFFLFILFFLLAAANLVTDSATAATIGKAAGYVGFLSGIPALYMACAILVNEMYGKTVFPI